MIDSSQVYGTLGYQIILKVLRIGKIASEVKRVPLKGKGERIQFGGRAGELARLVVNGGRKMDLFDRAGVVFCLDGSIVQGQCNGSQGKALLFRSIIPLHTQVQVKHPLQTKAVERDRLFQFREVHMSEEFCFERQINQPVNSKKTLHMVFQESGLQVFYL